MNTFWIILTIVCLSIVSDTALFIYEMAKAIEVPQDKDIYEL